MPKNFDKCIAEGGRVRTKKLSGNRYLHICFLGGKSFAGEVKTKKVVAKKPKTKRQASKKTKKLVKGAMKLKRS